MPTNADRAYARKQLRRAQRVGQIYALEELDNGAFVVRMVDGREWIMSTSMAIAFAKGLRIGHAHARNEVFA